MCTSAMTWMRSTSAIAVFFVMHTTLCSVAGAQMSCAWSGLGNGLGPVWPTNHRVEAIAMFDDGTGPAIYAGGNGPSGITNWKAGIAKFDGESWMSFEVFDHGFPYTFTYDLLSFDDGSGEALYAAGTFVFPDEDDGVPAYPAIRFNGSDWQPIGAGTGIIARALTIYDDGNGEALYIAGHLPGVGGIGRWDGESLQPVGEGLSGHVRAMAVLETESGPILFAGGDFNSDGAVAKWDGQHWQAIRDGIDQRVDALAVFDDGTGHTVYAGGEFGVRRWNGRAWIQLPGTDGAHVRALATLQTGKTEYLYIGGDFDEIGGIPAANIARWDGKTWADVNGGVPATMPLPDWWLQSSVYELAVIDHDGTQSLHVGGSFIFAGGVYAKLIARLECEEIACAPDLTADGETDVFDLLALLAAWGTCAEPHNCPADLDADGEVNVSHLLALLDAFGPCREAAGGSCFSDGTCAELSADACMSEGGIFQGVATGCDLVQCPAACSESSTYAYDNGTKTMVLGHEDPGLLLWLQRYEVADGGDDLITSICGRYGKYSHPDPGVRPGDPVGYAIYGDAGEGPSDFPIWWGTGTIPAFTMYTAELHSLPVPNVPVSGSFYVAVWVELPEGGYPAPKGYAWGVPLELLNNLAARDTTLDMASFDPDNVALSAFEFPPAPTGPFGHELAWMLRANGSK